MGRTYLRPDKMKEWESDPIGWWKERGARCWPHLAPVARALLSAQVNAADVERMWSLAGRIYSVERRQLKIEKLAKLVKTAWNGRLFWLSAQQKAHSRRLDLAAKVADSAKGRRKAELANALAKAAVRVEERARDASGTPPSKRRRTPGEGAAAMEAEENFASGWNAKLVLRADS